MNFIPGLFSLPPQPNHTRSASLFVVFMAVCVVTLTNVVGCKDRNKSPTAAHWDRIVEGQNNEVYFIDRTAIERVSDEIVRISVKYAPTKGGFLISLQDLSKEFGSAGQDIGLEYTVSTWEFNCEKSVGRCLSLTHFRKGEKIASYKYPDPAWKPLDNAATTKVLRDIVCVEFSGEKKEHQ
ncbi:MAG TPA: surface-adhesin E family protein [Syntrophorhabdales bacterium]|nr:surface-adhesin E family protein [Syntrophorhabdales bacterium]